MRSMRTGVGVAASVAVAVGLLVACGDDDSEEGGGGDREITISVSNLPPETEEGAREAFLERVQEFEDANPDIDIEPDEWEWEASTFAAQLAGGTLPTTFEFPFTDGQALIERGQLADISAEVEALPYAADFNPNVLEVVQDDAGAVYGVPSTAYGMGLHYNRTLFTEASLDPDKPPTTWEEVRQYANTIADATGQAGYAQMSTDNTGGWVLTAVTYAHGGRVEEVSGEEAQATINNSGTKQALEMIKAMRWEDDSMGDNFLYDWAGINQAFAGGQVGMYVGGSDVYNSLVTENNVNPDDYGLTVIPLAGEDSGVLGGGTIVGVSPDASPAERGAAVKWIDFFYMAKLTDQAAAVADAEALVESDAPLGTPTLPIFDEERLAQSDAWVADLVNVPLEQMLPFKNSILGQTLVAEPSVQAQELYAELDVVVQAVLTDQNADIDDLLETANDNVSAMLES